MTDCILILEPSMPLLMYLLFVWISCIHEWTESGFLRRLGMKVIEPTDSHLLCSWFFVFWLNNLVHQFFIGLNNLLKAYEDKSAFAMCIFSLALGPGEEPITFVGKTAVRCHFLFLEFWSLMQLWMNWFIKILATMLLLANLYLGCIF